MSKNSNNVTVNNAKSEAKQTVKRAKAVATATAKQTAKQSISIDELNASVKQSLKAKKQTATAKQSKQKQTAEAKQTATAEAKQTVKLSAVKTACRMIASLASLASAEAKAIVAKLKADIEHDDFLVVCKDTTSCALFIVDNNKNTVCNVYDCLRIQFTTVQARKYKEALLADKQKRFYTHVYKNNEFISCKCSTYDEFVSAMQFVYTVYMTAKQTATATEATAEAKAEAK